MHTCGPLDGSLYAKVVKGKPFTTSSNSNNNNSTSSSNSSSSKLLVTTGGDYCVRTGAFVNSVHVESTDSGISSAGVAGALSGAGAGGGGGSSCFRHGREVRAIRINSIEMSIVSQIEIIILLKLMTLVRISIVSQTFNYKRMINF